MKSETPNFENVAYAMREYLEYLCESKPQQQNFRDEFKSSFLGDEDYAAQVFDGFIGWAKRNDKLGLEKEKKYLNTSGLPIICTIDGWE